MPNNPRMEILYVRLKDFAGQAKDISTGHHRSTLRGPGFISPISIDSVSGLIIGDRSLLAALVQLKDDIDKKRVPDKTVPMFVVVDEHGDWLIPSVGV